VQFSEGKTYLANKLNIDYTQIANNALFSDADLSDFLNRASKRAWDYRGWPFTIEALKLTYSPPVSGEYYQDYPNTFEDESVFLLTVNDKEWGKRNFADYKKWFSDNPTATDTLWADFKRVWFANKLALNSGDEIAVYGKLKAYKLINATDLFPFSPDADDNENSGNQAIVRLAFADALASEKKREYQLALAEEKAALAMLDALWAPYAERKAREQSQNRSFFDVPDYFPPRSGRGQTNIGNFP
jgi:hypothetical protein